jgi:hypothetical protein
MHQKSLSEIGKDEESLGSFRPLCARGNAGKGGVCRVPCRPKPAFPAFRCCSQPIPRRTRWLCSCLSLRVLDLRGETGKCSPHRSYTKCQRRQRGVPMTMILSIQWRWMVLLMCVVSESEIFFFFFFFFLRSELRRRGTPAVSRGEPARNVRRVPRGHFPYLHTTPTMRSWVRRNLHAPDLTI